MITGISELVSMDNVYWFEKIATRDDPYGLQILINWEVKGKNVGNDKTTAFVSRTLSVPPVATTLRIRSDSPSTSEGGEEAHATH